jgi:hypothetical protein
MCEVAHTSSRIGELLVLPPPAFAEGTRAVEGAVMRTNLWSKSVPRVELDQRSREARLRLEQLERLLVSRAALRRYRHRRPLSLSVGRYTRTLPERRVRGPLSDRRPSRMPTILQVQHLERAPP